MDQPASTSAPKTDEPRRHFFAQAAAVIIGGIITVFPFAAGVLVLFDPLRKKSDDNGSLRVTTLDSVPDDGIPRQFPVIADRTDAWNRYPNEPIGAVYLVRNKGTKTVHAFNAICPHAGCFVDFKIDENHYKCPCHSSFFEVDGARIDPASCPSPRDLDALEVDSVQLNKKGEVWVTFKNYRAGIPEKIEQG
jgi:menaquinol-cytochrome c reductase iron-sulfur subunit